MRRRPQHIFRANHQKRQIREHDEDIAEVGDGPKIAEIDARQGTDNTKRRDENAKNPDAVDERCTAADAIRCNFREANHADEAGQRKQAKTERQQERNDAV